MAAARADVWGEAALKHPGGPSFEFFKDLLPPLRYVNTAFRHCPIVLSAPGAAVKARWASNGSGINLRADKPPMWKAAGTPVGFYVVDDQSFGARAEAVAGPKLHDGRTRRATGSPASESATTSGAAAPTAAWA